LRKLPLTSGQPADKPNWHHFSIQERMDYLKRCEADPGFIDRHDRKVRNSIAVSILWGSSSCPWVCFSSTRLCWAKAGRQLRIAALENYLSQKMPQTDADDGFLRHAGLHSSGTRGMICRPLPLMKSTDV
jgi:hypothetical protein